MKEREEPTGISRKRHSESTEIKEENIWQEVTEEKEVMMIMLLLIFFFWESEELDSYLVMLMFSLAQSISLSFSFTVFIPRINH